MSDPIEAVILELAPLPREQVGPFAILGVSKTADKEEIEANWAQRVIWSRKKQFRIPLEDVNWAREVMNDPERRVRADVAALNPDTVDGFLAQLSRRLGGKEGKGPAWEPLDREKPLQKYHPAVELPDAEEVRRAIPLPDLPRDFPGVHGILENFLRNQLDPWDSIDKRGAS